MPSFNRPAIDNMLHDFCMVDSYDSFIPLALGVFFFFTSVRIQCWAFGEATTSRK